MTYRRLRIVVSLFFALMTVVICILWVRSYTHLDSRVVLERQSEVILVQSVCGRLSVFSDRSALKRWFKIEPGQFPARGFHRGVEQAIDPTKPTVLMSNMPTILGSAAREAVIPYWAVATTCSVGAALSFPIVRFSLRTLLIVTTLIALMLGAAVWSTR